MNKGGMAALIGAFYSLRESVPDAQITALCHHPEEIGSLRNICLRFNIIVREHPWFKDHSSLVLKVIHSGLMASLILLQNITGRFLSRIGFHPGGIFRESDIILELDIDTLHDHYGIFFPLWSLSNLFLGLASGKPVVVWGAGIGTFKNKFMRLLTKKILNRTDLIVTREEVSKKYVKSIGIHRPKVIATADHAFMMAPCSSSRVDEIFQAERIHKSARPFVMILPSQLIHRYAFPDIPDKQEKYAHHVKVLGGISDYLIEKLDADILFIAHVIMPDEDDRKIIKQVLRCIQNSSQVKVLEGDYSADELKGIISRADMVIGERMHPMIASTSLGVPTVPVIYGEKAYGILGDMMDLSLYLINIAELSPSGLYNKITQTSQIIWEKKESVSGRLKERSVVARDMAKQNGLLVKQLLKNI
jgi:colanic acid/amylovoran biosynthesis protein